MTEDEMYDIIRGYEDSESHYHERNIELEAENAKLKRAAERDADVMESLNLSLEESQAENAKLRSELESVGTAAYLYGRGDLQAENAKLRDLALNCYRMAKQVGTKCKRYCSHWPECCENDSLEHCEPCRLTALAQELGIDMC